MRKLFDPKSESSKLTVTVIVAVLIIAVIGVGLAWPNLMSKRELEPTGTPKELESVEIRDYQGEKLSSINDFRENSIKGPQYVDIENYRLEISGLVENPKNYTYEEVLDYQGYTKLMELHCVEGWSVKILWEGILVKDLLAGVKVKPDAKVIIFHAYDGYSTSFPIDYIANNDIIIAYKMNNVTLAPERGFPFQLVAEEKWGYKWIKWITQIELSDDADYRGYWESRGYNQEGNVTGPMFD